MYLTQSRNGGCTLTASVRMELAKERYRRGLSYEEMGRKLGVGGDHFRRLERGMATPKYALLESWARMLGFGVEVKLVEGK